MDLRALTGDELDDLRRNVLIEQERRENLAAIPDQIEKLAKVYRDGGGDDTKLHDAITPEQLAQLNRT